MTCELKLLFENDIAETELVVLAARWVSLSLVT